MEREEAQKIIKELTGEEVLNPQTAKTMLDNYHKNEGRGENILTTPQYQAVYWASTQGERQRKTNPKKPGEMDKRRPSNFSKRFHRPR